MFYETHKHHGLKRDTFKSLVVPRTIGWISSQDAEGRVNLAPYSFFNAVASSPPIVMFSANGIHYEGGLKDSAKNAEETGEFVCNLATFELREKMNASSASLPRDNNEFLVAGLTPAASRLVKPPRVAESPVHLECHWIKTVPLPSDNPDEPNTVIFGQVVGIHISDAVIKDGMIDMTVLRPIARLGYMDYTLVDNVFSMNRPEF